MSNAIFQVPKPENEAILDYSPGSKERNLLKNEIEIQYNTKLDIPLIIGGKEIRTGDKGNCICPHEHSHILANYHKAGENEVNKAIEAALNAKTSWEKMHWSDRVSIFMKAADLISNKYRYVLNAATILNQGKNPYQAEIDATCELADFLRFNAYYIQKIYAEQPVQNSSGIWNRVEYRPLEGFVFSVSPFNFTAIAGNLATSPAIMGNTVVWKPASTSVLSNYYLMKIFQEAGLPDGVINFIPGSANVIGSTVLQHKNLAGVHFTGSNKVFNKIWRSVAYNIDRYVEYPRIVGETGGKDFIFLHKSANVIDASVAIVRAAFEYQGQKCSAASRAYIPESLWPQVRSKLEEMSQDIKNNTGNPSDFKFFNAVIDEASFDNTVEYLELAKKSKETEIIIGGLFDKSIGYFIDPTVILAKDPHFITMEEELFAPIITVYVYEDNKYEETLNICNETSPYALTGAIFASDRRAINIAYEKLMYAAGNFYINDKPTGAVVGQQPFGGGRASGTNDKAGFNTNLMRWTSLRTIKEKFISIEDYKYPFMEKEYNCKLMVAELN
ncbi:MAG: L-glutamate gamma-semialdehyde dehydrogenase [Cyanobacteriota bacterium]